MMSTIKLKSSEATETKEAIETVENEVKTSIKNG
jgi:hypothetical protein